MFMTDYCIRRPSSGGRWRSAGSSRCGTRSTRTFRCREDAFPGGGRPAEDVLRRDGPFVTLTAAAAATKRLKIGTGVCLVIQRDTIQTGQARRLARPGLGGRFCSASAAAGTRTRWRTTARSMHALQADARADRGDEGDLDRAKPEYHGDIVDFPAMMTWPKPVQKPHPPVIVGGAFPHAARRAVPLWQWLVRSPGAATSKTPFRCTRMLAEPAQPRRRADHDVRRAADADLIKRYRDLGVTRVVGGCPPEPADKTLPSSTAGRADRTVNS